MDGRILYAQYGGFEVRDDTTVERLMSALEGNRIQGAGRPSASPIPRADAEQVKALLEEGAELYDIDPASSIQLWRQALQLDPDNYVIRKQIWAVEHPEKFYPVIDWDWQRAQLRKKRQAERASG